MADAGTSACPSCGESTKTIAGRCPNCLAPKTAEAMPEPRYAAGGSLFDDLEDLLMFLVAVGPGVVLLLLALFVVASNALVVIAIVLIVLGLAHALLG